MCKFWSLLTVAVLLSISGPMRAGDPADPFEDLRETRPNRIEPPPSAPVVAGKIDEARATALKQKQEDDARDEAEEAAARRRQLEQAGETQPNDADGSVLLPEFQPRPESKGIAPATPVPAAAAERTSGSAGKHRPVPRHPAASSVVPAHALHLDGRSGYIDIPPTPGEDLNMGGSSLTMAIWIKPSQAYDGEELLVEHGICLSEQSNYLYQIATIGSNTLRFNFPAMQGNNWGWLDATVNLADGNWHFVAATFDTRQHLAKLYDNGVLLKSKRVVESIATDETPKHTFVGCRGNGRIPFQGEIGEILIYNRAISGRKWPNSTQKPAGIATARTRMDSWPAITSTKAKERRSPISPATATRAC